MPFDTLSIGAICRALGLLRAPGQVEQARLFAALRQLQVPLAELKAILTLEPVQAAIRSGSTNTTTMGVEQPADASPRRN